MGHFLGHEYQTFRGKFGTSVPTKLRVPIEKIACKVYTYNEAILKHNVHNITLFYHQDILRYVNQIKTGSGIRVD